MKEVLVVSTTQAEADRLMDDFIHILSNTGELDHVDRKRKTVYLKKSHSYRFIRNNHIEGFRGQIIFGVKFKEMMNEFDTSWKQRCWITRKILKIFNRFKKDKN